MDVRAVAALQTPSPKAMSRGRLYDRPSADQQSSERENDYERAADERADLRARQAEVGDEERRDRHEQLAIDVGKDVERGDGRD